MKKKLLIGVAVVLCLAAAFWAGASSYTFIGSLQTVNNTTSNSTGLAVGSVSGSGTFWIQNAGLTATNAMKVNVQISADNTNFITVATYWPAATNATVESFYPTFTQPLYWRAQVVTTNSVQVGVVYSF